MNIKRQTANFAGVAIAISACAVAIPGTAGAATGNVYLVVNNRVCGPGASVRGILANVQPSGWTSSSWDRGDNIIYPRVRLGTTNSVSVQAECYKKVAFVWQRVGFRTVVGQFRPTATGQTFWVG